MLEGLEAAEVPGTQRGFSTSCSKSEAGGAGALAAAALGWSLADGGHLAQAEDIPARAAALGAEDVVAVAPTAGDAKLNLHAIAAETTKKSGRAPGHQTMLKRVATSPKPAGPTIRKSTCSHVRGSIGP